MAHVNNIKNYLMTNVFFSITITYEQKIWLRQSDGELMNLLIIMKRNGKERRLFPFSDSMH